MTMGVSFPQVNALQDQVARIMATEMRSTVTQASSPNNTAQVNFLQSKFDILEGRVSSKPAYVCGRTFLSLPGISSPNRAVLFIP